jgi:tetratricopeptide (TPR) repeat protein
MTAPTRTRHRVVVDQTELARAIGTRIRNARLAAGLTQQALAGDRYTKAYISALELGHAKPSMAALDYLAPRLGTRPDRLLSDDSEHWTRLEADLHLAAGRFGEALEAFHSLAARETDPGRKGELLLGAGEAAVRLRRFEEAAIALTEARRLLEAAGRRADVRRTIYWLSAVHGVRDDSRVAADMLKQLLAEGPVEDDDPGFEIRVRIAIAQHEQADGQTDRARLYLEEAQGRVGSLEPRRQAAYYDALARVRAAAGDHEAAVRAGMEAIGLLRSVGYEVHLGALENELAVVLIAMGSLQRAEELARESISILERLEAWEELAHAVDTLGMVMLARGDAAGALEQAGRALALEADAGDIGPQVGARITRARALEALGRGDESEAAWADAIAVARSSPVARVRRQVLTTRARELADAGRHAEAYELLTGAV